MIAVDGLGRGDEFDETTDSSVRVQVGRLRKSLLQYCRLHKPGAEHAVYIRSGEYRLRLAPVAIAYPELAPGTPEPIRLIEPAINPQAQPTHHPGQAGVHWTNSWSRYVIGSFLMLVAITIVGGWISDQKVEALSPEITGPPTISTELRVAADLVTAKETDDLKVNLSNDIDTLLQKSLVSRTLATESAAPSDYSLLVSISRRNQGEFDAFVSLRDRSGTIITEKSARYSDLDDLRDGISDNVTSIISPAGGLSEYLAKKIAGKPANDFECFLSIENFRSEGETELRPLDYCLKKFPNSTYYPYFAAREVFLDVQKVRAGGGVIKRDQPEWKRIEDILRAAPKNTYANTAAAKMLIGEGSCEDARGYAIEGFSRGRTYPALELAIIADAYGCEETKRFRSVWDNRIERVIIANQDSQSPLLRAYMSVSAVIADKEALLAQSTPPILNGSETSELGRFNQEMDRYIQGELLPGDLAHIKKVIPTLIWNEQSRAQIEQKLAQRGS